MTLTYGFVGAGQLGEPMVYRLLDAGHDVLVCARRSDVRERLSARGADVTDSVGLLASSCDIVISCLFSDHQLHQITSGPEGLVDNARPGLILVSHTTGATSTLEDLLAKGVGVLDAPVSGTAEDIAKGQLTVLIGGPADMVDAVAPVLASYANPIIPTGQLGSALTLKLVNNALFAANVELVSAAMRAVRGLGGDSAKLLEALQYCSGGSRAATSLSAVADIDTFATEAGPFLRKDVAAYLAAVEEAGLKPDLLESVIGEGRLRLAAEGGS